MMRQEVLVCLLLVVVCVGCANALVPSKSLLGSWGHRRATTPSVTTTTTTMYFDDVSRRRYTVPWKPSTSGFMGSSTSSSSSKNTTSAAASNMVMDKQALIRRLLIGYNAQTASELGRDEIARQTLFWAQESGVVGEFFGDEIYHDVLGMQVSNGQTMMQCLTDLWQFVSNIIDEYQDAEFQTRRWLVTRNRQENNRPLRGTSHAYFLVFSHCPEAYEYKTFTLLVAALEFCKDLCVHLGKEFSVTLFHPKFKNSPTLFSPERHSPFPTIALQFGSAFQAEQYVEKLALLTTKRRGIVASALEEAKKEDDDSKNETTDSKNSKPTAKKPNNKSNNKDKNAEAPDEADEELGDLVDGRIADLDGTRAHLEILFNSAAASGSSDDKSAHPPPPVAESSPSLLDQDDDDDDETTAIDPAASAVPPPPDTQALQSAWLQSCSTASSPLDWTDEDRPSTPFQPDPLAKRFQEERKRRRRDIPAARVRQCTDEWAEEQRKLSSPNPALVYWDSLMEQEDGWVVCSDKKAEHVYAAVWKAILELYAFGGSHLLEPQKHDDDEVDQEQTASAQSQQPRKFNLGDWMNTLSPTPSNHEKDGKSTESTIIPPDHVVSRAFVTTRFMAFNAQGFKRFAITVNAALKRFTNGQMFIEVFHPEYVGNKGYQHDLRRSPFPMMLLCYRAKQSKKQ